MYFKLGKLELFIGSNTMYGEALGGFHRFERVDGAEHSRDYAALFMGRLVTVSWSLGSTYEDTENGNHIEGEAGTSGDNAGAGH
jgi:hypothetical protein